MSKIITVTLDEDDWIRAERFRGDGTSNSGLIRALLSVALDAMEDSERHYYYEKSSEDFLEGRISEEKFFQDFEPQERALLLFVK